MNGIFARISAFFGCIALGFRRCFSSLGSACSRLFSPRAQREASPVSSSSGFDDEKAEIEEILGIEEKRALEEHMSGMLPPIPEIPDHDWGKPQAVDFLQYQQTECEKQEEEKKFFPKALTKG